jgi:hypothetical protein
MVHIVDSALEGINLTVYEIRSKYIYFMYLSLIYRFC